MKTLKINIITQNIPDIVGMKQGLTTAQTLLAKINFLVTFDFNTTTKQFTSIPLNTDVVSNGYEVNPNDIISIMTGDYDITCLIYDWNTITPKPTNPCTNLRVGDVPMQIPLEFYSDLTVIPIKTYSDVLTQFFLHELSHWVAYTKGVQDLTHFQSNDPNWNTKQPTDYYLYLIQKNMSIFTAIKNLLGIIPSTTPKVVPTSTTAPITTTVAPMYKYFNPIDDPNMVGIKPELMQVLDKARGLAGVPFQITSGLRTSEQNTAVGGVSNSSHLSGLAADIAVTLETRQSIMRAFLNCGTPLFIEDATQHIHVDMDSDIHTLGDAIISQNG